MASTKFLTTYEGVVSQVVAKLRSESGFGQVGFAEKVGLSPSTWSRIENGESGLSLDHLRKAAEALGMKPYQVLEIAERALEATPQIEILTKKKEIVASLAATAAGSMSGKKAVVPVSGMVLGGLLGVGLAEAVANRLSIRSEEKQRKRHS